MAVDGIGSGGGRRVPGIGGAELPRTPGAAEAPAATGTGARAVSGPGASAALEQLQRGEITLDGYLDVRVGDAVQHLEGRLPAAQLDFVKQALREELSTDPVLVELVRRTTGQVPTPRTE